MVFRKGLAQRLLHMTKTASLPLNQTLTHSPSLQSMISPNPFNTAFRHVYLTTPDSTENGFFWRFLQKRSIAQLAMSQDFPSLPNGDKLMEKLRGMKIIDKDRLRLEELNPPPPPPPAKTSDTLVGISVEDAKKLLRASQLEMLKSKLRGIPKNCVSLSEFVKICVEGSSPDQGLKFSKMLDDSGAVIILGNTVFLHPEQVTRAIEGVIPLSIGNSNDPRRKELEQMEKEKVLIDKKAEALARRELWCGLGFLVVQTASFVRLTFWELSWDVMEPISFFVTSIYFIASYAFFLRTSKDPSLEGFFKSRFSAKQKRLMKMKKFDIQRFKELRKACYSHSEESVPISSSTSPFYHSERTLIDALHQ